MCEQLNFRKLKASEIQVRPTDTKTIGSCLLLLFQDARCAMNILDETVGCNWQKDYKDVNGNIYCGIGIKIDNEWRWRWDCGSFNANDDEMQSKADASDAMKRAAVCWNIGRELYSTPKIRIKCPSSYYYNGKMNMSFTVQKIEWSGNDLMQLVIVDKFNKVVFDYTEKDKNVETTEAPYKDNATILKEFCSGKKGTVDTETLKEFYNYWNGRIAKDDFKGTINPESLWKKHIARKAA